MHNVLLLLVLIQLSFAGLTADQILDSMELNNKAQTSRMEVTQIVYKANGQTITSQLIAYSADKNDKGLTEFIEPARIRGMKILTLNDGDDIWSYSPRTKRVRKIASHQKNQSVNGSDFSYEDLNSGDRRDEYVTTLEGTKTYEGKQCYMLTMVPKEETVTDYSKIEMLVDSETWMPLKSQYYDEYNELWKVLTLSGITKIGAYYSAESIEMKNVQKGTRTRMKNNKVEFDIDLDRGIFTQRYLSR